MTRMISIAKPTQPNLGDNDEKCVAMVRPSLLSGVTDQIIIFTFHRIWRCSVSPSCWHSYGAQTPHISSPRVCNSEWLWCSEELYWSWCYTSCCSSHRIPWCFSLSCDHTEQSSTQSITSHHPSNTAITLIPWSCLYRGGLSFQIIVWFPHHSMVSTSDSRDVFCSQWKWIF